MIVTPVLLVTATPLKIVWSMAVAGVVVWEKGGIKRVGVVVCGSVVMMSLSLLPPALLLLSPLLPPLPAMLPGAVIRL